MSDNQPLFNAARDDLTDQKPAWVGRYCTPDRRAASRGRKRDGD